MKHFTTTTFLPLLVALFSFQSVCMARKLSSDDEESAVNTAFAPISVKTATTCEQQTSSFTKTEGMCIAGYNKQQMNFMSLDQCKLVCIMDPECKSIDWRPIVTDDNGYNCAISTSDSSDVAPVSCTNGFELYEKDAAFDGGKLSVKTSGTCKEKKASFTKSEGMCIQVTNKQTMFTIPLDQCKLVCIMDPGCKSIMWRPMVTDDNGYNCAISSEDSSDVSPQPCTNGFDLYEKDPPMSIKSTKAPSAKSTKAPSAKSTKAPCNDYDDIYVKAGSCGEKTSSFTKTAGMCIQGYNKQVMYDMPLDQCKLVCIMDAECKSIDWRPIPSSAAAGYYNCAIATVDSSDVSPVSCGNGFELYEKDTF